MLTTQVEFARGALEAAPDAMIIIDASGIVCYANRQVESGHSQRTASDS
jgi:PAS domain-containing protein